MVPGGTKMVPGGTKMVPGGIKMAPGGTKMAPGGTKMAPRGTKMESKWHQNGAWRAKKIEKRGDPEKVPMVLNSIARFLTKNDEKPLVFIAFFEKSKSRKKVPTFDSGRQVLRPGEEVGGGVNPPFKDLRTSKPPIARRAGGIIF